MNTEPRTNPHSPSAWAAPTKQQQAILQSPVGHFHRDGCWMVRRRGAPPEVRREGGNDGRRLHGKVRASCMHPTRACVRVVGERGRRGRQGGRPGSGSSGDGSGETGMQVAPPTRQSSGRGGADRVQVCDDWEVGDGAQHVQQGAAHRGHDVQPQRLAVRAAAVSVCWHCLPLSIGVSIHKKTAEIVSAA